MKKNIFKIVSIILFIAAIVILATITIPLIKMYNNPEKLKAYIESLGAWGLLMMFFVQISQIVVALIPGEVVEFVAGALYGWFWGLIFCTVGIIVGQLIIFQIVRILGKGFVEKVAGSKLMQKYAFLHDEKKLKTIIFFLFFIPGTPKDMLTYIVPLTKVKLRDFLILTAIARIPSVLSSTFAGAAFTQNNLLVLIITYAVILVFTVIGFLIYKFIYPKRNPPVSETQKEEENNSEDSELVIKA